MADRHEDLEPPLSISMGRVQARFLGREAATDRLRALREQPDAPADLAYLRQTHSARVLPGLPGFCGRGDGLWTMQSGLALTIATADCVPLVIADQTRLAVVHAGWRGIVSAITLEAVRTLGTPETLAAWIGPAIRSCCYEVGQDVAQRLVAASDESVLETGDGSRPHVDLATAIGAQLRQAGVREIRDLGVCTHCHHTKLWSYRHAGSNAKRNYTLAWLSDDGEESE